jgi:hypothetical protein
MHRNGVVAKTVHRRTHDLDSTPTVGSPMPIARIIALHTEDARRLERELRSRGFLVETFAPGETVTHPADLEIILEECGVEEALHKASALGGTQDLSVYIASGVLNEAAPPAKVFPLASASRGTKPTSEAAPELTRQTFEPADTEVKVESASTKIVLARPDPEQHVADIPAPHTRSEDAEHPPDFADAAAEPVISGSSTPVAKQGTTEAPTPPKVSELDDLIAALEQVMPDLKAIAPLIASQPAQAAVEARPAAPVRSDRSRAQLQAGSGGSVGATRDAAPRDKFFSALAAFAALLALSALALILLLQGRSPLPPTPEAGRQNSPALRPSSSQSAPFQENVKTSAADNAPAGHAAIRQPASDDSLIAPDTVVRFDSEGRPLPPKKPAHHASTHTQTRQESSMVAQDTVVRYSKQANTPAQKSRKQ